MEKIQTETFKQHLLRRPLYLMERIDDASTAKIIEKLVEQESSNEPDVVLYINSGGGQVCSALALLDTMNLLSIRVHTICLGKAYSGAATILLSGTTRWITQNSQVMFHPVSSSASGNVMEMNEKVLRTEQSQNRISKIIKEKTGMPKRAVRNLLKGENFLDPKECLGKGIIDGILKDFGQIEKRIKAGFR